MDLTNYSLIIFSEEDQRPVIEDNKILVLNNSVNACEYVSITAEVKDYFNLKEAISIEEDDTDLNSTTSKYMPVRVEAGSSTISQENAATAVLNSTVSEKFTWSHKYTLLMLEEYKNRFQRFRDPKIKKKTIWEEMSVALRFKNYIVDADSIDRKMRNMKSTYRTICDNNNKKKSTGRGRINWEYSDFFVDMFQEDRTVHLPTSILSSTRLNSTILNNEASGSSSTQLLESPLSLPTLEHSAGVCNTPSSSSVKSVQANRLNTYRKRQLKIEEEKLEELKKIRKGIDESNKIKKEKLEVMKKFIKVTEN